MQVAAAATGPVGRIPQDVLAKMVKMGGPSEKRTCDDVFAAMQRIVDEKDPSYRD